MSRLDELPPDQRAALSLLLRQHKSYAEVAALLGIQERAVHDRAHAALVMLAPHRARELTPERRLEIGDYLLSQQAGVAERLRTRTYLSTTEPARAWASDVAAQIAPLAGAELPEIPSGPAGAAVPDAARVPADAPGPQRVGDLAAGASEPAAQPAVAASSPPSSDAPTRQSSRVGGAVLLAAIAVVAIVAIVLITKGGSSTSKKSSTTVASTKSSAKTKTGPKVDNEIKLTPTDPNSKSLGLVYVLSEHGVRAFFIAAQGIPAAKGFYYAVWLYNSPTSALPLSETNKVGHEHSLAGGSRLPADAGDYHEILLTKETNPHPTRPGHVVMRGAFSLS
jgi:hypothetical protein